MAELKTKVNDASVEDYLGAVEPEQKRTDARAIDAMMRDVTGLPGKMWGSSIVGYGSYHYRYDSGREGDWMEVGFAARKQTLTLYIMPGFAEHNELLGQLGPHKTGKSCLYIKRLADIDTKVLRELVQRSVSSIRQKYPTSG